MGGLKKPAFDIVGQPRWLVLMSHSPNSDGSTVTRYEVEAKDWATAGSEALRYARKVLKRTGVVLEQMTRVWV